MSDIQELSPLHGNTVDILMYLFQCRLNAQQIPRENFSLRFCVRLDAVLALEINKLKEVPFSDSTILDSINTAIGALQKTPETKQLAASYSKQLEALMATNKKIVSDFRQQLQKGEELQADQDEFFKNTVIPSLIEEEDV